MSRFRSIASDLPRRFKVAYIDPDVLLDCLVLNATFPGDTVVKVSLKGVPPGTLVLSRFFDHVRACDGLCLYHESWPEVAWAEPPPVIRVSCEHVRVGASAPRAEGTEGHPIQTGSFTVTVREVDGETVQEVSYDTPIAIARGVTLRLGDLHDVAAGPVATHAGWEETTDVDFDVPSGPPEVLVPEGDVPAPTSWRENPML